MRIAFRRAFLAVGIAAVFTGSALAAYPTARTGARLVYDGSIGRIVLFGGVSGYDASSSRYEFDDTWEWSGAHWIRKFPATSPEKRSGYSFNYVPVLGGSLLFGGVDGDKLLNDTWLYRGGNWQQVTTANAPSARAFAGSAYDPATNTVVLYGGSNTTTAFHDTWRFDGTTWTKLLDSGPTITHPIAVWDGARKEILLIGWNADSKAEMYRWKADAWERVTPATIPECVRQGALAYEATTQKVLYVGGGCSDSGINEETWQWDGTTWAEVELQKEPDGTTTITQDNITGHGLAFDPLRGNTLLFGGDDGDVRGRTLTYANSKWTEFEDQHAPGAISLFVFEHDPARGVSWLFGGHNEEGVYSQLWKLSGSTWELVTAGNGPTVCLSPVGSFDTDRGRLVVVCEDSTTFEWDGAQWYSFPDLQDEPPAGRKFSSMVYDPAIRKSVLFGGYLDVLYSKETWVWNGTSWTRVAKSGDTPSNRSNAAMFYDPSQQKVFLFGGIGRPTGDDKFTRLNDMWSFDGTKWTQLENLSNKPSPRYGMQVRYDAAQNKTVMFGGKDENEKYLAEQWEWNGTSWTKAEPAVVPPARMNGQMMFDAASQRLLLYGGYAGFYYSELWQNIGGAWSQVVEPAGPTRRIRTRSHVGSSAAGTVEAAAPAPPRAPLPRERD